MDTHRHDFEISTLRCRGALEPRIPFERRRDPAAVGQRYNQFGRVHRDRTDCNAGRRPPDRDAARMVSAAQARLGSAAWKFRSHADGYPLARARRGLEHRRHVTGTAGALAAVARAGDAEEQARRDAGAEARQFVGVTMSAELKTTLRL